MCLNSSSLKSSVYTPSKSLFLHPLIPIACDSEASGILETTLDGYDNPALPMGLLLQKGKRAPARAPHKWPPRCASGTATRSLDRQAIYRIDHFLLTCF